MARNGVEWGAGEVASCVLSCGDFVGGLPRLLAAPPGADLGWHGPVLGDDRLGLGRGDRPAVGVADDVGGAAAHDGPGPLGQAGRDDAQRAEMVLAALGHLLVVDAGELGVLLAGVSAARTRVVRSSEDPALDMGWPLRSVSPVSEALGARPV